MGHQSSSAPAGTDDRWADPVLRRRGIANAITAPAVMFAVPAMAASSVTVVVLRRAQPAGLRESLPPARAIAVGVAAGGLTGALFGATLGAASAVLVTAIRRYLDSQRPSDQRSRTPEEPVTDTGFSATDPGST